LDRHGKVVAITGGGNGIGYALARRGIAAGGKAVLLDKSATALEAATGESVQKRFVRSNAMSVLRRQSSGRLPLSSRTKAASTRY
jgi:NAD(P)-dependent dehydrogenase (short-subunit alcohol dehydrogenase family)